MISFFTWNKEQLRRLDLVAGNPLSKALGYVQKREPELRVYLDDPSVDIDTNHLERALRCIPMGGKNWMFCWTLEGADNVVPAAKVMTLSVRVWMVLSLTASVTFVKAAIESLMT